MFSSRVPKRLSTPRLMRTLDFIKWVLDTSKQGKNDDKGYRLTGKDSKLRPPAGTGCRTPSTVIIPRRAKPCGAAWGGAVLNRFGEGDPGICRKPGTDMNFRRSLPEIRCLSL